MIAKIKYLLFDAANTLIYKPELWAQIEGVLKKNNICISNERLRANHKLLCELVTFPDRTSKYFYSDFNSKLLYSLGIIPSNKLLDEIYSSCSYLPWCRFDDTSQLLKNDLPMGILSNFNNSLTNIVDNLYGRNFFDNIFISENEKISKPSIHFFNSIFEKIEFMPQEILYIGDSVKLDMEPAIKIGFNVCLIDRDNYFDGFNPRISNLEMLNKFIESI